MDQSGLSVKEAAAPEACTSPAPKPATDAELEGGCLCGDVRYRVDYQGGRAEEGVASRCYCHCRMCQRACASTAVPWVTFRRESFSITKGTKQQLLSQLTVLRLGRKLDVLQIIGTGTTRILRAVWDAHLVRNAQPRVASRTPPNIR